MTGMKEGAGEDPFAEDERNDDEPNDDDTTDREGATVDEPGIDPGSSHGDVEETAGDSGHSRNVGGETDVRRGEDSEQEAASSANTDTNRNTTTNPNSTTMTDTDAEPGQQATTIPYKLRRNSVQDGRNRVPLFLQSETKAAERDALRELEDRFDEDVSLTDLREALIVVGLGRLDEAEERLEQWGYGMTFDV